GCNAVLYKRPSCVMDALIFTCKSPVPGKSRTVATTFSLRQPWMAATTCLVVYLFDAPYDVSSSAAIFAFGYRFICIPIAVSSSLMTCAICLLYKLLLMLLSFFWFGLIFTPFVKLFCSPPACSIVINRGYSPAYACAFFFRSCNCFGFLALSL